MTLKQARQHVKAWPERYYLECKYRRGDDNNRPLFMFRLMETKDWELSPKLVYSSAPLGVGRNYNVHYDTAEWLMWET